MILQCDDAVGKRRHFVGPGKEEHQLDTYELLKKVTQLLAHGGIEAYKGVVEDEYLWLGHERLHELELAEFPAGE